MKKILRILDFPDAEDLNILLNFYKLMNRYVLPTYPLFFYHFFCRYEIIVSR